MSEPSIQNPNTQAHYPNPYPNSPEPNNHHIPAEEIPAEDPLLGPGKVIVDDYYKTHHRNGNSTEQPKHVKLESDKKRRVHVEPTSSAPRKAKRAREDLAVMSERPNWLPDDWRMEVRTRSSGASAGSMDRLQLKKHNKKPDLALLSVPDPSCDSCRVSCQNPLVDPVSPFAPSHMSEFDRIAANDKDPNHLGPGEEQTIVDEANIENQKPNQDETQESGGDKQKLCMHPRADISSCEDVMTMTDAVTKFTAESSSSQQSKKGPDLEVGSARLAETPDWLPEGWFVDTEILSPGFGAGSKDLYYVEPVSGRRFRSKNEVLHFLETGSTRKRKLNPNADDTLSESTGIPSQQSAPRMALPGFDFDFNSPPQKVTWTYMSDDEWIPSIDGVDVPESTRKEWAAVFEYLTRQGNNNGASKPPN